MGQPGGCGSRQGLSRCDVWPRREGVADHHSDLSPAAREEATRDGAPPVDLISGEDLCDLLKDHELGVKTTTRLIEDIEVVKEFFDEI
jgi:restriction endonuclease Mrr